MVSDLTCDIVIWHKWQCDDSGRWGSRHEDEELRLRIWRTKRKSFRRELNVFFGGGRENRGDRGARKLLLWCYDMTVRWRRCNVGALLLIWQVTWHVTLSFDINDNVMIRGSEGLGNEMVSVSWGRRAKLEVWRTKSEPYVANWMSSLFAAE
jgi:hypothetical protein